MDEIKRPSAARYLVSASRAIPLTQALLLAEKIHKALVEHSDGSSAFTGCDSLHRPLKGHAHAYIFCECIPGPKKGSQGEITHVTIFSSNGFSPEEKAALQRLTHIYGGNIPDVGLSLMSLGRVKYLGGTDPGPGHSPLLASSRRWVSCLPFLPARHPKFTRAGKAKCDVTGLQIDSPEHELRRLLRLGGFPEPLAVEHVDCTKLGESDEHISHWAYWSQFTKIRSDPDSAKRDCHYRKGYGFRIIFPKPVEGPLALGYASHLGMGSFVSELEEKAAPAWISPQASRDDSLINLKGDMQISLLEANIKFLTPAKITLWSGKGFMNDLGQRLKERICAVYIPEKDDQTEGQKKQQKPYFRCKKDCQLSQRCSYGRLFLDPKHHLSPIEAALPLILSPPAAGVYAPDSDGVAIGMSLIGSGNEFLPHLVLALKYLGATGLGLDRLSGAGRFILQSAVGITPQKREMVYIDGNLQREIASFGFHDILNTAHELRGSASLKFLTPTCIGDSRGYSSRPAFCRLVFHLLLRANMLSCLYGTGRLFSPEECSDLIKKAEEIDLLSAYVDEIYPRRQMSLKTDRNDFNWHPPYFKGEIIYSGLFSKEIVALLMLGEIIHVGKGAEAGNGMFRLRLES